MTLDMEENPVRSAKEELDALAAEFDSVPTTVCRGCETHGNHCIAGFCEDPTIPGGPAILFRGPSEPGGGAALAGPLLGAEEEYIGSNEDEWEVVTVVQPVTLMSELVYGGEG